MKKFILVIILALVMSAEVFAQIGPSATGNSFGVRMGRKDTGSAWMPTGYRGIAETGHGFDFDCFAYTFSFSTTQGYQFNPHWFLGGHVSFGTIDYSDYYYYKYYHYYNSTAFQFKLAADSRYYFLKDSRATPFIQGLFGFEVSRDPTVYAGGAVGGRFAITSRFALNISMLVDTGCHYDGALLFKVGCEF